MSSASSASFRGFDAKGSRRMRCQGEHYIVMREENPSDHAVSPGKDMSRARSGWLRR